MSGRYDLIVIGAGPAGAEAALAAARHGLDVVVLEEADAAGGQIHRAPAPTLRFGPDDHDPDREAGEALRARLAASGVTLKTARTVWSIGDAFRVDAAGPEGSEAFEAPRLIAATGAHERVVPFPGWTLPGVMGLAAATILLKAEAMLPGRRVVVAGCGPLLAAVAAKILKYGGDVAAVVDLASRWQWLRAAPALASRPALLRQGVEWVLKIRGRRVPIYSAHGIRRAEGSGRVERVVIGPVDEGGAPRPGEEIMIGVDALTIGHGLVPGAEVPKLLQAEMRYDALRGGWVPVLDVDGRTSIAGLYAAGDGAGLRGGLPAAVAGQLAGLAAARDAQRVDGAAHSAERDTLLRQLAAARPFADAMAEMMALRPGQAAAIAPETVVCRCEDVTRSALEAAVLAGAHDINQVKHFTRCGMGPCQGRMCGDVAAELIAQKLGRSRTEVGFWTGRPPLRPVPLDALLGEFSYDDIPIPPPAPL